jgi:hypothetical protein
MSIVLPLLTRQRLLGLKVEAAIGVAESLTSAEAAHIIWDAEIQPQSQINRREGVGSSMSPFVGTPGAIYNQIKFRHEMYGNSSAALPGWTDLLKMCGMAVSGLVISPQSGSPSAATGTMGAYRDGRLQTAAGCMGNFTLTGESGKAPIFEYDFMGTYIAPTTVAIPAPTFPTIKAPKFQNATFTWGGTPYTVKSYKLSPNNKVVMRETGETSGPFGLVTAVIVDRAWSLEIDPESLPLTSQDWYAAYAAGTTGALSIVMNGGTNNTWTIAAPIVQLNKPPAVGDRNGYMVDNLSFDLCRSAAAGDDEITFTQS